MPYVFSDSYGGVAQQRFAADQMNIGIQRDDAARRDAALAQQRAEYLAAQQQAAQYEVARQKAAFDFGLNQQTRADNLAANAQTRGDQIFQFNAGQKFVAAENAANRKANLDASTARNTQQESGADYNEAFQQVNNGTVRDPVQFKILFPKLSETEIAKLTAYSLGRNKVEADNYDALLAAANEATGFIKTKNPGVAAIKGGMFGWGAKPAVPASQLDEDAAFALATNHRVVARNLDKLAWDAVSQRFVPAIAPPTGYVMPTKRPGFTLPTPPVAGTNAPALPPTSGTGSTGWVPPSRPPPVAISSFGSPSPYTPPPASSFAATPVTAPAANRVRVLSPQGKIGSIPAQQLGDALANGYILVK